MGTVMTHCWIPAFAGMTGSASEIIKEGGTS
jgi:hypothetical protein